MEPKMKAALAALREAWQREHDIRKGVVLLTPDDLEDLQRRCVAHGIELAMAEVTEARAYPTFDYPMHELIDRDDLLARLDALKGGA